jgi:hypothetical protein
MRIQSVLREKEKQNDQTGRLGTGLVTNTTFYFDIATIQERVPLRIT